MAYDVPGRDCSQYSAGGAATGDDYRAWIDGFAAGLIGSDAIVILEPDGLALLPGDCGQPDTYDRVSLIADAAAAITAADPNARVYLDAGHSAWHSVGDMAARLAAAGVQDVAGFFLDVSNYRATEYETHFGTWISKCIAFGNDAEEGGWRLGHYDWCASQYYSPFGPVSPGDISAARVASGGRPAGLVQPARPRARLPADARHRRPAPRRVSLGEDPGRVRRAVLPVDRGAD